MTDADLAHAAAPPSPPPRADLISPDLVIAAKMAPRVHGSPVAAAYPVRPYSATAIPAAFARQLMSRMSWGFSQDTWGQMRAAGGPMDWFEQQLHPARLPDPTGDAYDRWYGDRMRSAAAKWGTVANETKFQWDYAVDLANWSLLRRSRSSRQLHEVMTDFWSNHFPHPRDPRPGLVLAKPV